jgi:hypothetical protein
MSRFAFSFALGALVLVSVASTACAEHTTVHVHAAESVSFDATCTKTVCEAIADATPAISQACKDCISTCVDADCLDTDFVCEEDCRRPACNAPPSACARKAWLGNIQNGVATPGVETACEKAAADRLARCAPGTVEDIAGVNAQCARAALVGTEVAAAYYECYGAAACSALALDCNAPSTLGDELCAMSGASCSTFCDDASRAAYNAIGGRLKPALHEGAKTCLNQATCDDVNGCMDAWFELVH